VPSACILTCAANAVAAPVHDRMPCVLAGPDEEAAWLAGEADGLLGPLAAERTAVAPANPAVNKAGVEGAALLTP
jgi:putative SOS response-associated peptidase YedK